MTDDRKNETIGEAQARLRGKRDELIGIAVSRLPIDSWRRRLILWWIRKVYPVLFEI